MTELDRLRAALALEKSDRAAWYNQCVYFANQHEALKGTCDRLAADLATVTALAHDLLQRLYAMEDPTGPQERLAHQVGYRVPEGL